MAAKFINNVRVRCKEGSEQEFLAATEVWVNPDGMTDALWAKTGDVITASWAFGRARRR